MSSPSPSQILMIGGTGRVGRQVIDTALSRGHHITALVRKPNSIAAKPHLTQIVGDPTSTPDLINALTSISSSSAAAGSPITIITTLGQTRSNPSNPWSTPTSPPLFMTNALNALVSALRQTTSTIRVAKLIVLSMFGTGASRPYLHWSLRWVMNHSAMKQTLDDHEGINDAVLGNFGAEADKLDIPFVVLRCPMLKFDEGDEGDVAVVRELGNGETGLGVMTKITVSSLCRFLVDRVGDDERLDGTMPVIAN